jgi:hypothetical protein
MEKTSVRVKITQTLWQKKSGNIIVHNVSSPDPNTQRNSPQDLNFQQILYETNSKHTSILNTIYYTIFYKARSRRSKFFFLLL